MTGSLPLSVSSLAILMAQWGGGCGGVILCCPLEVGAASLPFPDPFSTSSGFGCREKEALTLKICQQSSSGSRTVEGFLVRASTIFEAYLFFALVILFSPAPCRPCKLRKRQCVGAGPVAPLMASARGPGGPTEGGSKLHPLREAAGGNRERLTSTPGGNAMPWGAPCFPRSWPLGPI